MSASEEEQVRAATREVLLNVDLEQVKERQICELVEAGTARQRSPRHPTHFEPRFLLLNDIL
jgi:ABC-type taurine transport system ATPase subunit